MIILRQKSYGTGVERAMVALNKEKGIKPSPEVVRWNRGNAVALERAKIHVKNYLKPENIVKRVTSAKEYVNTHSPGDMVRDGMVYTGKYPFAATGTAAGYAVTPVVGYIPGTSVMAGGVEGAVRKAFPRYKKNRDGYINKKTHPIPEKVGKGVDYIYRIARGIIPV